MIEPQKKKKKKNDEHNETHICISQFPMNAPVGQLID